MLIASPCLSPKEGTVVHILKHEEKLTIHHRKIIQVSQECKIIFSTVKPKTLAS